MSHRLQHVLHPGLVLQQPNSLDGSVEDLVPTLSQLVQEFSLRSVINYLDSFIFLRRKLSRPLLDIILGPAF